MNSYQFLSEVYRLLADAKEDNLRTLMRSDLPDDVRQIVNAFLNAKRSPIGQQSPQLSIPFNEPSTSDTGHYPFTIPEPAIGHEYHSPAAFEYLLERLQSINTTKQFLTLLQRGGVKVPFQEKESKGRILRRVNEQIARLSSEKRKRLERFLQENSTSGETEGWMKVIRSQKR